MRALIFLTILFPSISFAWNAGKCSKLVNTGWFRQYKFQGYDQPLTKETKSQGSSGATTDASTETSTAAFDPGHWSKFSTSGIQGSSSWGDCSLIGFERVKADREKYFVQNQDEVLKQIATGRGTHLETLASFSLCETNAVPAFSRELQKRMARFIDSRDQRHPFGSLIDEAVQADPELRAGCHSFDAVL